MVVMPAVVSSRSAALIIGPSCPKSAELTEIPAAITELLVLGRVDLRRLLEGLARELLVIAGRALRRIGVHLGAVHREHPDPGQPRLGTQRQHLAEQAAERRLVALTKPRDRAVIG